MVGSHESLVCRACLPGAAAFWLTFIKVNVVMSGFGEHNNSILKWRVTQNAAIVEEEKTYLPFMSHLGHLSDTHDLGGEILFARSVTEIQHSSFQIYLAPMTRLGGRKVAVLVGLFSGTPYSKNYPAKYEAIYPAVEWIQCVMENQQEFCWP